MLHRISLHFFASSRVIRPVRSRRGTASQAQPRFEHLEPRDLPAPLTWNAGITLPEARGGLAAAMQNGAVAVFDGSNADVPALTVSNPTWQGSYSMDAFLPAAVNYPGVGLLPDGTALVFGGQLNGTATNTATLYDYTGDGTTGGPSMSTARAFFGFATDQNNNVYAIGGVNQSGSRLSSVEYFNQDANSWTLVTSLPQALSDEPAASDGAGHIFTFGGVGANGAITNNVYEYTIATKQWSQVASMPFAVLDSAAVLGSNGRIYVLGGTTATGTTASVESYSPSSNTWTAEAPLPSPVSSEAAITDPLGRIEVIGGFDANSNPVANVWISQQLNVPDTAPVFTTTPVTQLYSWNYLYYQVLTTGNPQPTYALTTAPTGMTIDPITGLINWTPTSNQVGNQNVTIQASNYAGATTQSFTIALVAPTLPAATPPPATAGSAYTYPVTATGNPTPTFSLGSAPAGMTISSTGTISWTPTQSQGGPQTFTVQASNYVGQGTQTYTVDVTNNVPQNVTAVAASTTSVTVSWQAVYDPAGATYKVYNVSHANKVTFYTLVASGLTGTSVTIGGLTTSSFNTTPYTYVVTSVDDATGVESAYSSGASAKTLFPPVIYAIGVNGVAVSVVQAYQGVLSQAQIAAWGNESPTFSLVSGPSTMSVDPVTGIVSWTPGTSDLGTILVTFQAANSVGSSTYAITYNVVSSAPVLTLPPNQTVAATSAAGATDAAAFTATATDPGGLTTTISYAVGSTPITSTYTFPIATTTVTVTATDTAGNSSTGTFTVLVQDTTPPTLTLPPSQQVESSNPAGSTDPAAFTATATDPVDPNPVITYFVGNTVINSSYVFPQGTTTVTVTATDSAGNSSSGTFTVFVGDIPPTLSLSGLPNGNTVTEGTTLNLTATGSAFTSAENAFGLTFTWTVTKVHDGVTTTNFANGSGTGSSVPISFLADDEGTYTVSVTATDVNGASTTIAQAITSTTVAPTTSLSGPSDGVTYQPRQFTLTATSPSPVDQAGLFSFAITWGDGSSQTVSANSGTPVTHAYAATGAYTVTVTATDKDGVVGSTVTQGVTIKTIENQSDSASLGGATGLAMGGTAGNDAFVIATGSTTGTVSVSLNGTNLGTFTPTGGALFVFGGPGTDRVTFKAPSGAGTFSQVGSTLAYSNSGTGVPLFNLTLTAAPDVENLVVQGGNTASSYTVQNATITTSITAGSGNDTFTLTDSGVATQRVSFNGGSGTNSLTGANLDNSWSITGAGAGTVQAGGEPADSFSNIQNLTGGSATNLFVFGPGSSVAGNVTGGSGSNTLNYSSHAASVAVNLQTHKVTGVTGIATNLTNLIGGTGSNKLTAANTANSWTITGANSGTVNSIAFTNFGGLIGGNAGNTFTVVSGGSLTGTLAGTGVNNTLVGPNTASTFDVTAYDAGNLGTVIPSFTGIQNLTGGTQANAFVLSNGVLLAGNLSGGAGGGTLDLSHFTTNVAVNLQTHKATDISGLATNLSAVIGGSGVNSLTGANVPNTWNINSSNAGTLNASLTFTAFANLTGGTANNYFVFSNGQGVTGKISGRAGGINRLDYSAYTTGIYVNLKTLVATGTGSISAINQVFGGNGNDILVGTGSGILLHEGAGNNLIIGGSGQATIQSGSGQDIVIAGSTSYDTNQAALAAIESYWATAGGSVAQRAAALAAGITGGYMLNASTVTHAAASDTLTLGSANDWAFWRKVGTNADTLTGTPAVSTFI